MKIKRIYFKVLIVAIILAALYPTLRAAKSNQSLAFVAYMNYLGKALTEDFRLRSPEEALEALQAGLRTKDKYAKLCYSDKCLEKTFRLVTKATTKVYGVFIKKDGTVDMVLPHSAAFGKLKEGEVIQKIVSSGETETDPKKFIPFLVDHTDGATFWLKSGRKVEMEPKILDPVYLDFQGKTAIITLYTFKPAATEKFASIVKKLRAAKLSKVVFDMRYCPGGRVKDLVAILSMLLPYKSPLFAEELKGRNVLYEVSRKVFVRFDLSKFSGEIVGLKSHRTASSGEIFLGVLKYNLKDKINLVGPKTYGKWSTLAVKTFPVGGAILTVGEIHLPDGRTFEGEGI